MMLSDHTTNDALYLRDGVHLNNMGSRKLLENLKLINNVEITKPRFGQSGNKSTFNTRFDRNGSQQLFKRNQSPQIRLRNSHGPSKFSYSPKPLSQHNIRPTCWL